MKGIIQAYALFVLLMGIALGYMLYIRIDVIQYMAQVMKRFQFEVVSMLMIRSIIKIND